MPIEADYWAATLNRATADQSMKNHQVIKVSNESPVNQKAFSIFKTE